MSSRHWMGQCESRFLGWSEAFNCNPNQSKRIGRNDQISDEPFISISTRHGNTMGQRMGHHMHTQRISNILLGKFTKISIQFHHDEIFKLKIQLFQSSSKVEKLTKRHATSSDLIGGPSVPRRRRNETPKANVPATVVSNAVIFLEANHNFNREFMFVFISDWASWRYLQWTWFLHCEWREKITFGRRIEKYG